MTEKAKHSNEFERRDRIFGGVLLVAVGILALLTNIAHFRDLGFLILPFMGACFLAWGFFTGRFGFIIPGCILLGLGLGVLLTQSVVGPGAGGVVILGLAAGFLGISVIGPYFEQKRIWWPLIPGGILGVIGALLLIGDAGLKALEWLGRVWPLILVAIGVYVLLAPRRQER